MLVFCVDALLALPSNVAWHNYVTWSTGHKHAVKTRFTPNSIAGDSKCFHPTHVLAEMQKEPSMHFLNGKSWLQAWLFGGPTAPPVPRAEAGIGMLLKQSCD